MSAPLIAWLSDFGTADHYVGVMKGVALTIAPDVVCVDITHGIPPQDVLGGALELAAAHRFFPPDTIFVAVVDPGVGTRRRAVAIRVGSRIFVGPDNGIFTMVLDDGEPVEAVELTNPRFALPSVSRTFEGRDRFAPAAAWLARGVPLGELGPVVTDLHRLPVPQPREEPGRLDGEILRVDRFGNAVSNLDAAQVDRWRAGDAVEIIVGPERFEGIAATYADVPAGSLCAVVSSSGYLEVAMNGGHAAGHLGIGRGTPIVVVRAGAVPRHGA